MPQTITKLLSRWQHGDAEARQTLMPQLYDELLRLARLQMRRERDGHTWQATELVHEIYGRLVDLRLSYRDRVHFFSMVARLMRQALVDHAREKRAAKRGGGAVNLSLSAARDVGQEPAYDVLDLDAALARMAERQSRAAQAVELHYFGGLSYLEIAETLKVSPKTVERDLRFARAWLRRELAPDRDDGR